MRLGISEIVPSNDDGLEDIRNWGMLHKICSFLTKLTFHSVALAQEIKLVGPELMFFKDSEKSVLISP